MQCSVENCGRVAAYKKAQLCQMHYFRVMRNGTTEKLPVSHKQRVITPNGYVRVYEPGHALADKGGYVFEHRYIMWAEIGAGCMGCELCGKSETWATCHVDHIDDVRLNNVLSNLRILCRGCNVKRGFSPDSHARRTGVEPLEFDGVRLTAHEWSRDPRVSVTGKTIRARKLSGMSDYDALFGPKKTHNGAKPHSASRAHAFGC